MESQYSIKDLIDIERLRGILEKFSSATGFTTGFVSYPDQELLITTGWRDICTRFHRPCAASAQTCRKSNIELTGALRQMRELNICPCDNGLVDGATPVIVHGRHLASVSSGQIFLQQPDLQRFRRQAEQYGYDVDEYLRAVAAVPVVSRERFQSVLSFLADLAVMVSELASNNLALKNKASQLEHEVKERRQAGEALRCSEERYRRLHETMTDCFAEVNMAGQIVQCNRSYLEMLGYDAAELQRLTYQDITPSRWHAMEQDIIASQVLRCDYSAVYEKEYIRKDGTIFPVELRTYLLRDASGRPEGMWAIVRDITERKNHEAAMIAAKEEAQRANEAKSQFLRNMSHELRTPMNAIMGMTALALMTDLNDHQRKLLGYVDAASKSLLRLINDIIDLSTIEAGKMKFVKSAFSVRELLRDQTDLCREISKNKALHLELTLADNLPDQVWGDPHRLSQVLNNLLGNAVKFTPSGRIVVQAETIDLQQQDVIIGFSVTDSGIGISADKIPQLFNYFSQLDEGITRKYGGSGLGLAISKSLVEQMGGTISVKSEFGKGSVFSFSGTFALSEPPSRG